MITIQFASDQTVKILNGGQDVGVLCDIATGLSMSQQLANIFKTLIQAGYSVPFGYYQIGLVSFNSNPGWGLISTSNAVEVGPGHASHSQDHQTQSIAISFEWLSYLNPQVVKPIDNLLQTAYQNYALPPLPSDTSGIVNHHCPGHGALAASHAAKLASILTQTPSSSSPLPSSLAELNTYINDASHFMPHYFQAASMLGHLALAFFPPWSPPPSSEDLASKLLAIAAQTYTPATLEHPSSDHMSSSSSPSSSSSSSPSSPDDNNHPAAVATSSSALSAADSSPSTSSDNAPQPTLASAEPAAPVGAVSSDHEAGSAPSSSSSAPSLPPELDNSNPSALVGALAGLTV